MSTHEGPGMSRTVARYGSRATIGSERGISIGSIARKKNAKTLVEEKKASRPQTCYILQETGEEVLGHKRPLRQETNGGAAGA